MRRLTMQREATKLEEQRIVDALYNRHMDRRTFAQDIGADLRQAGASQGALDLLVHRRGFPTSRHGSSSCFSLSFLELRRSRQFRKAKVIARRPSWLGSLPPRRTSMSDAS